MKPDLAVRIRNNPKFGQLVQRRTKFGWQLTIVMLVIYYGFIMLIAFAPNVLGTPLWSGANMTWGIPVGILVILAAFGLTGAYVARANSEYDELTRQIIEESK